MSRLKWVPLPRYYSPGLPPIHNLAKRGEVDISIITKNDHGEIDLKWEVSYNKKHGDARQIAYKLDTLVINRKIDELARPLPKIIRLGSLREIGKDLGVSAGKSILNLRTAFLQNAFTGINAKLKGSCWIQGLILTRLKRSTHS